MAVSQIDGMDEAGGDNGAMSRHPDDRTPRPARPKDEPLVPERSADDSDAGWSGTRSDEPTDDERLQREVPPHW